MKQKIIFFILFLSLCVGVGCEKKPPAPTNIVTFEGSVDDLFSKAIDQLQSQGFTIGDFDKKAHTAKSDWKTISAEDLQSYAVLKNDPQRYEHGGRIAYQLFISGDDVKATLKVDAILECMYTPSQREGDKFGTNNSFQPEASNGAAEKNFIVAMQQ